MYQVGDVVKVEFIGKISKIEDFGDYAGVCYSVKDNTNNYAIVSMDKIKEVSHE